MRKYLTGNHHISLKQVPSVLALKGAGSPTICKDPTIPLDAGFALEEFADNSLNVLFRDEELYWSHPAKSRIADRLLDLESSVTSHAELMSAASDDVGEWTEVKSPRHRKRKNYFRIDYEDFFRIVAGRFLADELDLKDKPRVIVWSGDVKRLQDQISPYFFEWEKYGKTQPKHKVRFQDVLSPDVQLAFLLRRTHWGFRLNAMCKEESDIEKDEVFHSFADGKKPSTGRMLRKVLKALLEGSPDPRWTNEYRDNVYVHNYVRDRHSRSVAFLEMLKTVEGVLTQRMVCYPHEAWTYEKYDLCALKLIWELSSDCFLDGQLSEEALTLSTRFSELKKARKLIKHQTLTTWGDLGTNNFFRKEATWLRFLLPLYQGVRNEKDPMRRKYLAGTLSQTRGCGKPPAVVMVQSKIKFLKTVTIPDTTTPTACRMVRGAMQVICSKIPDTAFTGLGTKASITVNSNATLEKIKKEHGTIAAVQEYCSARSLGEKAMTYDLDTGKASHLLGEDATPGEYIFWRSLEELLWMTPGERRTAFLAVVSEPGKGRAITKVSACVKIVLDLVHRICSVPLAKGFPSSSSGMEASHHAWNVFKSFETEDFERILFDHVDVKEDEYTDYKLVRNVYASVFVVSTDYETATDFLSHKIAKEIGLAWMYKCGIPKLLRDIVCEIAYGPRTIRFHGEVKLDIAVKTETENVFEVTSCRGVLMGDPLTKIVLHFTNIVTRFLAQNISNREFLAIAFPPSGSAEAEAVIKQALKLA